MKQEKVGIWYTPRFRPDKPEKIVFSDILNDVEHPEAADRFTRDCMPPLAGVLYPGRTKEDLQRILTDEKEKRKRLMEGYFD